MPRASTTSPARTSSPARRTFAPGRLPRPAPARRVARCARPAPRRRRPRGTTAPVEMRTAVPAASRARGVAGARLADHLELGARGRPRRAKPSIAELSNGGTSIALVTSSASTRPSAVRERDALRAERPHGCEHPLAAPPRSRSGHARDLRTGSGPARSGPRLRRSGVGSSLPPGTSGVRTERRLMTPIRGPLARLDRSREELAKAWLVRLIERASLDEIRELPTERIARELPELITRHRALGVASTGGRPVRARRRAGGARRVAGRAARRPADARRGEVARDVASLQAVLVRGAARRARRERPRAVRRRRGAARGRHGRDPGGRGRGAACGAVARARVAGQHRPAHRAREPALASSARSRRLLELHKRYGHPFGAAADGRRRPQARSTTPTATRPATAC